MATPCDPTEATMSNPTPLLDVPVSSTTSMFPTSPEPSTSSHTENPPPEQGQENGENSYNNLYTYHVKTDVL